VQWLERRTSEEDPSQPRRSKKKIIQMMGRRDDGWGRSSSVVHPFSATDILKCKRVTGAHTELTFRVSKSTQGLAFSCFSLLETATTRRTSNDRTTALLPVEKTRDALPVILPVFCAQAVA
jgi:hypothetical protein